MPEQKIYMVKSMKYQHMSHEELFKLLLTEEDRLSRDAVDEIVRRGPVSEGAMHEIIDDDSLWQGDIPGCWAPIHAVHILGSIGGILACEPLLKALIKADQYDNDWILEMLPSIVRGLPLDMADGLRQIVSNTELDCHLRSCAAECLAGLTLTHPSIGKNVFMFLGDVFLHDKDTHLADLIGTTLMDFQRREYYDALCERGRGRGGFGVVFDEKDVQYSFAANSPNLSFHTKDWLEFYAPKAIAARQERWAKEDAEKEVGGEILDDGMCICSRCGSEKKIGGVDPSVENPDDGVLCLDCLHIDLAERKGISVGEARKEHEQQMKSQHMMNEVCMDKYFMVSGKKSFDSISEANDVLRVIVNAWNSLTTEERRKVDTLDNTAMRKYFESFEIDFSMLVYIHQHGKPGRNDHCPCGSGKKFKKCCLEKVH